MPEQTRFADLPVISSALVASALPQSVGVISGLQPVSAQLKAWGRAFTVRCRSGDNLALHRALALVGAGDVLVVEMVGDEERGHWGELMTIAAQARGMTALVIDGTVRDTEAIAQRGFPVFSSGTHPLPAAKNDRGETGVPIVIRGVAVAPGDGICADSDGVVVVPAALLAALPAAVARVVAREEALSERLAAGETTLSALGLDTKVDDGATE